MMKMLVLGGFVVLVVLSMNSNGAMGAHLTDEFSVGTSLNKYLWGPKDNEEGMEKRDGEKRTSNTLWFGPRLGKRSQNDIENFPEEILEILEKVKNSPELQSILAEKLQIPYVIYVPSAKSHESHLISNRPLRDSPDMTNLNSRPYPPRFGRSFTELPPYLPRLGRSSN